MEPIKVDLRQSRYRLEASRRLLELRSSNVHADWTTTLERQLDTLGTILDTWETQAETIRQQYQAAAQPAQFKALAEQTAKALAPAEATAQGYAQHLAQLRNQQHHVADEPAPSDGEQVRRELRAHEVRLQVQGMAPGERQNFVRRLSVDGSNDEVLLYILEAPLPLVPEGMLHEARQQRLARADPALAKHIDDLAALEQVYTASLATARRTLEAAGLPQAHVDVTGDGQRLPRPA
jgi:hypothetical protein